MQCVKPARLPYTSSVRQFASFWPKCVQERRTQLFSATMTSKVAKLQRACLRDPVKVEVRSAGGRAQRSSGGPAQWSSGGVPLLVGRRSDLGPQSASQPQLDTHIPTHPLPMLCLPPTRWPPSIRRWRRCASSTCLCPPSTRTATSLSCSPVRWQGRGQGGGAGVW